MNAKTILILIAGLLGTALIIGGGYVAITNLIQPEGNLFEGVALASIGVGLNLMVLIASTIGRTIIMFSEILAKQTQIHKEMTSMNRGGNIGDILKNIMPPGTQIHRLDADPAGGDSINRISEILSGKFPLGKKALQDMNLGELEDALAKAVKKDNFERAEEIKKEIEARQGLDNQEDKE